MKYIRHKEHGIILFPNKGDEGISHYLMAERMFGYIFGDSDIIVSAGFVEITNRGLNCYGESTSLNIVAKPKEDSEILNSQLGM